MTMQPALSRKTRRALLCIYGAALLYYIVKLCWYAVYVGATPDEVAHLSYLAALTRNPALIPDFASLPLYAELSQAGGRMVLSPAAGVNYLGHPSLYYLLMTLADAIRFQADGTVLVEILRLRIINIVLTSAAMVLVFYLGWRRLQNRRPLVHALYAAAVVTLPELGYVSSGISNDNLAFIGFVLFFAGLLRYDEDRLELKTYLLIGVGFLLGAFSKLTTAMIMLIMLVVVLVMSVIRTKSLKLIASRYFLVILPCFLLFLAYELIIHRRYGGWQPTLSLIAPEFYETTVFYVAPENRVPMSFFQFFSHFALGIAHSWSRAYGHNEQLNTLMDNGIPGLIFWVPVAAAVVAAVTQLVRRKCDRYTLPAVLGFAGTLAWHLWSGWSGFRVTGYAGGAQARYYLFLIVPFALILCEHFPPLFRTRKAKIAGTVIALLLIILWLAGDAPRLLFMPGLSPA